MYNSLLLEDFQLSLKRYIAYNRPVSTFLAGVLAGLYTLDENNMLFNAIRSGVSHYVIDYLDDHLADKIEPIINKFTTPVKTVVERIKDGSFLTPNTKLFDIIQYGVTFLLLSLGFVVGRATLLSLGIEKKQSLWKSYTKFVLIILSAFAVIVSLIKTTEAGDPTILPRKFNLEGFKHSKSRIKRAYAAAYEIVAAKYPQITKIPLYYVNNDLELYGLYYDKWHDKNIIGIPNEQLEIFSDHELIGAFIHELGHLLELRSESPQTERFIIFMLTIIRAITETSWAKSITSIGADILDRFFASLSYFNQEIFADVFAASFGYGPYLRSFLRKFMEHDISEIIKGDIDSTYKVRHGFLSHPNNTHRIEYIAQAEKYFKKETEELLRRTTQVVNNLQKEGAI
jgi:Zn-dependent protease with chaperone function